MAQLKDTTIDGTLNMGSNIIFPSNRGLQGIHPTTGEAQSVINLNNSGNTVIGYGGYQNANGLTNIYGNDVNIGVAQAGNTYYRPYRRAGDSISFSVRTSGYVTNSGKDVYFVIPTALPIVGAPTATAASEDGFCLRQGSKYTHGCSATAYVHPTSYVVDDHFAFGFVVKATFSNTTNVTNNDAIGIYWNGTISLS